MNIQLVDSLEEFDLRYIESCNQCSSDRKVRSDSITSRTNRLTLSSPLSETNEQFPNISNIDKESFAIFNDRKLKLLNENEVSCQFEFKRPPLKPSMTDPKLKVSFLNELNYKNLGNPFYKPPIKPIINSDSPTKKRKISFNRSSSSFESLLSLHYKNDCVSNERHCDGDDEPEN